MTLLSPLHKKIVLTETPLNRICKPYQQQVLEEKNKEMPQLAVPEKFGAEMAKFKKGHFFGQKDTLNKRKF